MDRVFYRHPTYGYRERRGIEDQVSELVELLAEICDSKGIDVSEFNQDYVKTGD